MPFGVCMTKAEIMDWVPGSHGSTFSGNPLCLAAALATMEIIEREAMANAATVGAAALARLHTWVGQHEIVGDVRGRGLMIGVEIVEDKQSRKPGSLMRERIVDLAFERGLMLLGCGENTIRLCPPLVVTQDETDVALDILEECIALVSRG
jgi:4-aminobutyrate aminotransferase